MTDLDPGGTDERLAGAIRAIDDANSRDPNLVPSGGDQRPKELVHSELMTDWLHRLDPQADEAQQLAARAHHFRRWTHPRGDYPDGRSGYLRWRAAAKRAQADDVAQVLRDHDYGDELIERVGVLIRKEGLGSDRAVQVHEDALCLVFLERQLGDLAERVGDEEMVVILERTLPKMSEKGRECAASLDLGDRGRRLLAAALSSESRQPDGDAIP